MYSIKKDINNPARNRDFCLKLAISPTHKTLKMTSPIYTYLNFNICWKKSVIGKLFFLKQDTWN